MSRSAILLAVAALAACGDSSSTSPADCGTFTDLTAATAVITFGGASGLAYVPRCAKVRVDQPITFSGDFAAHPLSQTSGAAGAIPQTSSGTTLAFSIGAAGTYEYQCDLHHGAGMTGAIQVVP